MVASRIRQRGRARRGPAMARARTLTEFQAGFPDEASCAAFLFERRWPEGFVCPACGDRRAARLRSRAHTYECLACGRQTSITAGTVMHRSKLPLTVWFWAAHLMATHSNGMSALQFEAQLGITYKTAWLLAQKLRRSMIDPQREPLEGVVEVDQAEIPFRADNSFFDPVKSGKILVAGAVEVIDRGTNQAKPRRKRAKYLDTRSGRIRLTAIPANSPASFETMLGLASRHRPTSYWDIVARDKPRKGVPTVRRQPRRRKTATGMQQDGSSPSQHSSASTSSG